MDDLHTLVQQQLKTVGDHIRIVVVHPNFRHQYAVRQDRFWGERVYLCLDGDEIPLADLKQRFLTCVEAQAKTDDLSRIGTFILDESDRSTQHALSAFIKYFVTNVPNARLVVLGRQIPEITVKNTVYRDQTLFLPHEKNAMLIDYAQRNTTPPNLLEVRALGKGDVYLNGHHIERWDGTLPRSLFFYLIDRGMVTREIIFETFWPTLEKQDATNVFHVTKRKVSEVLGIDLTAYYSGYYRISPEIELVYDTVLFNQMIQQSEIAEHDEAIVLRQKAIALYCGDFLNGLDLPWANRRRQQLREAYSELLLEMAADRKTRGDYDAALGYYLQAMHTSHQQEDIITDIMHLHIERGQQHDALMVYNNFAEDLFYTHHQKPGDDLQALARKLRQQV
jgi:DNA-binding SARP family transcriptional activator